MLRFPSALCTKLLVLLLFSVGFATTPATLSAAPTAPHLLSTLALATNDAADAHAALSRATQQDQLPQSSPSRPPMPGLPRTEPPAPSHGKTEQYTLSEDRYEKAVAYNRASYTLYFVAYFLSFLILFLVLQLGWAAKFRDFAERATDKRWLQAFIFVPLLLLTLDV